MCSVRFDVPLCGRVAGHCRGQHSQQALTIVARNAARDLLLYAVQRRRSALHWSRVLAGNSRGQRPRCACACAQPAPHGWRVGGDSRGQQGQHMLTAWARSSPTPICQWQILCHPPTLVLRFCACVGIRCECSFVYRTFHSVGQVHLFISRRAWSCWCIL